jgi:hypothetical protein
MSFHIAPRYCAAVRDEDLVLLDLAAGDYACAPGAAAGLDLNPSTQTVAAAPSDLAAQMLEAGVLRPGPGDRPPMAFPPRPAADLGLVRHSPARLADLPALAGGLCDMVGGYWGAGFPAILRRARRRQAAPLRRGPADEVAALARRFADLLPWAPFPGDCLFRALLLQAVLRRRGFAATLVIGVQTWPFEAHAWVQADDLALDDGQDHAGGFTPILAL